VNSLILHRLQMVHGMRAFAHGHVSLLLPLYMVALGMTLLQIGIIATGTLLGFGVLR
jgi:hypothetical protein